ncbi:MAG: glycosyltransferase family 4 protein [Planctomycetes bacterium]|nr:glycosyltransferase family 4 protein [Planctomycetota bacterium]
MRIRLYHMFFHPDSSSVSQIISDLAFHLASRGHAVEAVATCGDYHGGLRALAARQRASGVDIRRVWGPGHGKKTFSGRLADLAFYCYGAATSSLFTTAADVAVYYTYPPMLPTLGLPARFLRNQRFIYAAMDLYPDVAVRAGLLRQGGLATRALSGLTRAAFQRADRVIVLGRCMAEEVARDGLSADRIAIVPNWADGQAIGPVPPEENPLRRKLGLRDEFVVMYSGNMGVSHFFDDLLDAARRLRDRCDIRFVFAGAGLRRGQIESFKSANGLENIIILDYFPRGHLRSSLCIGDAHFVSLRDGFEGLVVPSKAYGAMAAGRPIIYQGSPRGEIARVVAEEGVGQVVRQNDPAALADLIASWANDRQAAAALGQKARNIFMAKYDLPIALARYESALAGDVTF